MDISADVPGPGQPLSPEEEIRQIEELQAADAARGMQDGDTLNLLNQKWYLEWLKWVGHSSVQSPSHGPSQPPLDDLMHLDEGGGDGPPAASRRRTSSFRRGERPGPIDNKPLLEDSNVSDALRTNLMENHDFQIVSTEVFNLLIQWYEGGPAIRRRAITGMSGTVTVELHGLDLKVYKSSALSVDPTHVTESKMTSVLAFKERMCAEMGLEVEKVRIWDYFNEKKYLNLEGSHSKSLDSCRIYAGNAILLEEANADGTFPEEPRETSVSSYSGGMGYSSYNSGGADVPTVGRPPCKGAVGLQNLGNTCFMNSSLQCLSNVPQLREFFTSGQHTSCLNTEAYKTKGKLAESFAQLLSLMWKDDTTVVAPRNFKGEIGRFAEQFSGYGQQDSMELIEYVLDGLKEDVNRVRGTKPYVEIKEADGRPDEIVAEEAQSGYTSRNNSLIDDLFLGFFKSTVRCPTSGCNRESITFDPFFSVKLGMVSNAEERMVTFSVTVVPSNALPARESAAVSKGGTVAEVVAALARKVGLEPSRCLLAELWSKKIHKIFNDDEAVEHIQANDVLLLFELEDPGPFRRASEGWNSYGSSSGGGRKDEPMLDADARCGAALYHRQAKQSVGSYRNYGDSKEIVGIPSLVVLPQRASAAELFDIVSRVLAVAGVPPFSEGGAWKLYRVQDKWSVSSGGQLVLPEDQELFTFSSREYLAVEWDEGAELPPQLAQSLAATEAGKGGRASAESDLPLERCFQMFTEEEQLSRDDAWYCNKCKDHVQASKRLQFWTLPRVLVVQLKRFTYTRFSRDRLDTAVRFPMHDLDLGPYCVPEAPLECRMYELCGVSKHIGALGGGHYVAYARSSIDGQWYFYNDSSVNRVEAEEVLNDKVGAYVLFYIRQDCAPSVWRG